MSLTLCDPMAYSPPGSSVQEILQERILEWVTIPFSRRSRDRTRVSCIAGRFFTTEPPGTHVQLKINWNMALFIFLFFPTVQPQNSYKFLEAAIQGSSEISLLFRSLHKVLFLFYFFLQTISSHPTLLSNHRKKTFRNTEVQSPSHWKLPAWVLSHFSCVQLFVTL